MWSYNHLIQMCRKYARTDVLHDKFVILEWRLQRRYKRLIKARKAAKV